MMPRRGHKRDAGTPGVLLAGQALRLLRQAPLAAHAAYLTGTVPFIAGWLWFWSDMAYGAYAYRRLGGSALLLALLFVWMKVWQARFGARLLAFAADDPPPRWTRRTVLRSVLIQGALQPSGFVVLPLAMIMALPYPWCSAFYQNLLVLDRPSAESTHDIVRQASRLAAPNIIQNLRVIWMLSPWSITLLGGLVFGLTGYMMNDMLVEAGTFGGLLWFAVSLLIASCVMLPLAPFGTIVFANAAMLIVMVPKMLNTFLGIHTPVTTVGVSTIFNASFLAMAFALTYLVLAPLFTAAHALRCFESASRKDGRDLLVALRRSARAPLAVLMLAVTLAAGWASADPAPVGAPAHRTGTGADETMRAPDAGTLDSSIDTVLQQRRYTWRMPNERDRAARELSASETDGWLENLLARLAKWAEAARAAVFDLVEWLIDWLDRLFDPRPQREHAGFSTAWLQGLTHILIAVLACTLGVLLYRWLRDRQQRIVQAEALPELVAADLEREDITADQRPSDEWRTLAETLATDGEYRLAVRALFLSMLSCLGRNELVTIARYKANRDYLADLRRRAHDAPQTIVSFHEASTTVECHWYGRHQATSETVDGMRSLADELNRMPNGEGAA